jgi:hypothetical protein
VSGIERFLQWPFRASKKKPEALPDGYQPISAKKPSRTRSALAKISRSPHYKPDKKRN